MIKVDPLYQIPDDDLVGEVLIPAMAAADEARIGAGFFSSRCFAQIAPGLADFLAHSGRHLSLLISPEIDDADREALERGTKQPEQVIHDIEQRLLADAVVSASALVQHTLDCLAYLIATGRLTVRFALMARGQYHKKKWLLRGGTDWLAVHGSGNATARGLLVNGEQMTVDRPWADGPAAETRVTKLLRGWERDWNNENPHVLSIDVTDGLRMLDRRGAKRSVPTIDDFWRAWQADHMRGLEPALPPGVVTHPPRVLVVPDDVEWETGLYRHQGVAVRTFIGAGSRGILAIATGGGKTQTSLIAAANEQDRHTGPMLIVIIVPTAPLMRQWIEVVRRFGIEPAVPSALTIPKRRVWLEELKASLTTEATYTTVVLCTQQLFVRDEGLRESIEALPQRVLTMLIGDEVHNLGAPTFLRVAPHRFDVRLGLSATPSRQYDEAGSAELFNYFGPPIYEFTLADAIEVGCLTPYRYYLHEVRLTADEFAVYVDLSRQLRRKGFNRQDDGSVDGLEDQIEHLLRKRRAVLEQASAKIVALEALLVETGVREVARTLIYASAKQQVLGGTKQLDEANALLRRLGIRFHEFTSAETGRRGSEQYLEAFGRGEYQALTAMKVLDEGIDLPETDTAYLLASSTVRREWVQRRGRILRRAVGKSHAILHDFIVLPPSDDTNEGRAILAGELARAREFAGAAENEYDPDGPRTIISRLERSV
ncbi:DEAD/DEAH box helicase family protein [Micromonospora sp. R77]|uniref:DEAD/DEAH box helicase family protein n=1 Tax=Micromonospora sp. R77 TaxID=2925836 RepID=UPI001F609F4A|nr:DEAD/DEAH box helicase family protein [Micromonospora sp. R77]MCI4064017.1 DEAD/DEAH box helicase family protein [Micromonospora sp. R77]